MSVIFELFWGDCALLILCHKKLVTDKMKRTAPERFASELCCVSNIFAFSNWKEQNFFRQLAASLRGTCILSVFLVQVKLGSAKKMDPPKTQIFVHQTVNASGTWEVKGVMKLSRLSLLGRRKCCKNAKGQRYLGVGENNSLGLAFRNICSQLPREVSNCQSLCTWLDFWLWIIQRERQELLSISPSAGLELLVTTIKLLSIC